MILKSLQRRKFRKSSYSQCGEDLIIRYIFDILKIKKPSYWDIGAFHPFSISNTALFYQAGSRGVNVEPNPVFFKLFEEHRKKDVNINAGVAPDGAIGIYFQLDVPTLNTFSEAEANSYVRQGHTLICKTTLNLLSPREISEKYFKNELPDFLTLDVEGLDYSILNSLDYEGDTLIVICVETISYSTSGMGVKDNKLIQFMIDKGYLLYADTYINSIFVKKKFWFK